MQAIIETRQLTHTYSQGTPFEHTALDRVDFSAQAGEYLAVIGRTGSGKSTLIQHLNGLLKPTSGQVLFDGADIWEDKSRTRQVRCQVGLVFQYPEYQLFEETVYQDIAFGPKNMGLDGDEVDRRVKQSARFVGLEPGVLEKSPFDLSGGQKRRVAIAGVIAMEPRVLVLDEPTAGLDPEARESLFANIERGWSPFWATSGNTTRPTTPPSSWCPTPWRRWPGRQNGWWSSTRGPSPSRGPRRRSLPTGTSWRPWAWACPP